MTLLTARIVDGKIDLPDESFPDGTEVMVVGPSEDRYPLTSSDQAELESRLQEIRAGDFMTVDELNQRLERL